MAKPQLDKIPRTSSLAMNTLFACCKVATQRISRLRNSNAIKAWTVRPKKASEVTFGEVQQTHTQVRAKRFSRADRRVVATRSAFDALRRSPAFRTPFVVPMTPVPSRILGMLCRIGGEQLDHDERFGTLWRLESRGDELVVMIEVVNATPEKDGSFKHYFLRVPPSVTRAREAVAWTFDVAPELYLLAAET
jgi:hypothetical protein